MKNKKQFFITTAIWGNFIGYILFKMLGKFNDSQHEWDKDIVYYIDNALIIILTIAVLGIPGSFYYTYEAIDKNDVDYVLFVEAVFCTGCITLFLSVPGIVLGRVW